MHVLVVLLQLLLPIFSFSLLLFTKNYPVPVLCLIQSGMQQVWCDLWWRSQHKQRVEDTSQESFSFDLRSTLKGICWSEAENIIGMESLQDKIGWWGAFFVCLAVKMFFDCHKCLTDTLECHIQRQHSKTYINMLTHCVNQKILKDNDKWWNDCHNIVILNSC